MNNTVKNDCFGFTKVKWLQYTGKVGKFTGWAKKTGPFLKVYDSCI